MALAPQKREKAVDSKDEKEAESIVRLVNKIDECEAELPDREKGVREAEGPAGAFVERRKDGVMMMRSLTAMMLDFDVRKKSEGTMIGAAAGFGWLAAALLAAWWARDEVGILGWATLATTIISILLTREELKEREAMTKSMENAIRKVFPKSIDAALRRRKWKGRLYETKAGFRLICTNRRMTTSEPEGEEFAIEVGCVFPKLPMFFARVSPSPEKIGISRNPEESEAAWMDRYEKKSRDFAVCRFMGQVGAGEEDGELAALATWHDVISGAKSGRPLA